jgi:outer membrane lipoprotein LolB
MRALALALAAAVAVTACVPSALVDDGLTYAQRRARLEAMTAWEADGRLAIDTGERAFMGRFRWRQTGRTLLLAVRVGPFGAGSLRVEGALDDLRVTARGETWRLTDAETQLSELVGWWVPVGSLPSWLRGLPDPSYPAQPGFGRYGTLTSLEQRRWQLSFTDYEPESGVLLPTSIAMTSGRLDIRLRIDSYTPAPSAAASLN